MNDGSGSTPATPGEIRPTSAEHNGPRLVVAAAEAFNYAAWQNSVPLIDGLTIDNTQGPELNSVTLQLQASSPFARPKSWTIDRVLAGGVLTLPRLELDIAPEYLDRLDEAERAVLTFQLIHREQRLCETSHELRILARDEWGGMAYMGVLLPAFVTPNDPALAPLLKAAANVLSEGGQSPALDGYQSADPNRSYLLAAALWSAVAAKKLTYANPPGSFEKHGQKTRRVQTILTDGLATCLDLTLLFASGLEALGLNSVLIMLEGHCFVGVWLIPKMFKQPIEPDCVEIRKAIAANEFVVFETTLVTHAPPVPFATAVKTANAELSEQNEHKFVALIDVARARMSQILPLATHGQRNAEVSTAEESGSLPLPVAPGYQVAPSLDREERPPTPAGRIERWQRKLLDLSLRNRLLNFRPSKQTVPVLCPDLSRLEDRLAEGVGLRLVSLSDGNPLGQRSAELHQQRTQQDLDWEFARQALNRDEIACPVEKPELDVRLTALYRKARNDLAEGGSNTLYLAVGFLRWKQTATDERSYRAPLLLVPVKLTRRSASAPFYLSSHEDDVRFNATLLQLLKKDFDCDLTDLEYSLPMDDSGVDVPQLLDRVRQSVREVPGCEVVEEAAIAPFSFAKYLMWKDLVDRVQQLERNRVVRHLIQDPDQPFTTAGVAPMTPPREMDRRYAPHELIHPLPADSSQLAAVMAAAQGHDFVIVGPPGTGKSQTIANLIAQCLAVGKTVLFVAEKTAALDVVHRRLREHGLGDCCVELHSNKAERRRFLDQLDASWKKQRAGDESEWVSINQRLQVRRDELNEYVEAVHALEPNGWSAYRAMGECVRGRDLPTPPLAWPSFTEHDAATFTEFQDTVTRLATTFAALPADLSLPLVQASDWSMAWEQKFLESCRQLAAESNALAHALQAFAEMIQTEGLADLSLAQMAPLFRLAHELARSDLPVSELVLHDELTALAEALTERARLADESAETKALLEQALVTLGRALGLPLPDGFREELRRPLFQIAVELLQRDRAAVEMIFHNDLEALRQARAQRPALVRSRDAARQALEARHYNSVLIDRLPIAELLETWQAAQTAFWPFSAWKKNGVKRQLAACMKPGGTVEPDLDLQLFREYQDCRVRLDQNLAALGLPEALQAAVDQEPAVIDAQEQTAVRFRQALEKAGLSNDSVRQATQGDLKSVTDLARKIYTQGKTFETLRSKLKDGLSALNLSEELRALVKSDPRALDPQMQSAVSIRQAAQALGLTTQQTATSYAAILACDPEQRRHRAQALCDSAPKFRAAWENYAIDAQSPPVAGDSKSVVADAQAQAQLVLSRRTALKQWTAWIGISRHATELGLTGFVDALRAESLSPQVALSRFHLAYARWWLPHIVDRREPLRQFQKFQHEVAIQDFCELDDLARAAAAPRARQLVTEHLPATEQVPRKSELGLLKHQIGLKRPSKSIREMIAGMPNSFATLAPCLLMSPLSIAQYLPADLAQFDVVVFDEASQIATWDAIGAIARGNQTIIVGDPKQLPPPISSARPTVTPTIQNSKTTKRISKASWMKPRSRACPPCSSTGITAVSMNR
ncbi:MAG: DUF4011 domain-containing protein [Planctomycetes bacterium]|nr:DUF4011 domain-containing protein [Planctomycetota bacterium]